MKAGIVSLLLFSSMLLIGADAHATPARVLIIRHGEKPADASDPNLSPQGYQRAQALADLFQIHPEYADKGLPVAYFAAEFTGNNAHRAVQTITPLAQKYGQSVLQPDPGNDPADLAKTILSDPSYDGKTVMIAWVHQEIPQLAQALGASTAPSQWDGGNVFDRVWILDYSGSDVQFSDKPESVLPGDSK